MTLASRTFSVVLAGVLQLMGCRCAFAQTQEQPALPSDSRPAARQEPKKPSPWLLAPLFNSNPKLGTSFGAVGGYIHFFDQKSRPSIFALQGQYSNTNSIVAAALAKTSFDEDRQRLIAGAVYGNVKNDYDDYLGTGVPLRSNGELRQFIGRYLYRVKDDWFIGAQAIRQNFAIGGETPFDQEVLDILGIRPFKSGGIGLVGYHDSRDNENTPTKGWVLSISNVAYREGLGSDQAFDVYRIDFRYYLNHGDGNVFAIRQLNHLTNDAPAVARAPVQLRGYKIGQYSAEYMSSIEGEERLRLAEKWTATAFAGLACLYGGGIDCTARANMYPMAGAGVQYALKPEVGIVLNLEYARGKDGNSGFYLKLGYSY